MSRKSLKNSGATARGPPRPQRSIRSLLAREAPWGRDALSFATEAGGEKEQQLLLLCSGEGFSSSFDFGEGAHWWSLAPPTVKLKIR